MGRSRADIVMVTEDSVFGIEIKSCLLYTSQCFPDEQIVNACVHNLNWTHIRSLLRVADENARYWYMKETIDENWSSRTLDRNISTQYYYRLLQAPKKDAVIEEMKRCV